METDDCATASQTSTIDYNLDSQLVSRRVLQLSLYLHSSQQRVTRRSEAASSSSLPRVKSESSFEHASHTGTIKRIGLSKNKVSASSMRQRSVS